VSSYANVLLLSMRSGGHSGAAGLSLTVANHAFIMDPAWNPALEDQAIARIARIGQKRETTVWRLLTENTVEDRVVEIATRKRETGRRNGASSNSSSSSSSSNLFANVKDQFSTEDVCRLFDLN
jgi:SNF2 family DNA or RNA helicase